MRQMTTTTLILVLVPAVAVLYAIWVGIPLWMVHRHPDTAPDNRLPEYLRADWENVPWQNAAGTVRRPTR
jgi:hypothetical protein